MHALMTLVFTLAAAVLQWQVIDDGVMGGLSASRVEATEAGTLVFHGRVSLENNGGFASIRSGPARHDLGAANGIVLRVRGDGKRYKLNLRTDAAFDGVQYQAAFDTRAGEWLEVRLPFDTFQARFRGRRLQGVPPLDPSRIVTFGFLISDRQEGAFRLEIDTLSAWHEAPPP
jgi:monofunctional biosynthetic peptidoglycan transglycosylase